KFYNLDALKDYKWYWRIEPGVRYTCAITYDPFVEMARREKVYGYTVALWEEPKTCPGLFRAVDDYRVDKGIPAGPMWNAMVDASWKPWPLRKLMAWLRAAHTDGNGDGWNLCHYWSNFEIADLDFFRGERYQELFGHLDRSGGFYDERWGDAPVHSLAVHLLLEPGKLHHFSDIGYDHKPFYQCPGNAPGGQLEEEELEKSIFGEGKYSPETEGTIGCRCECNHHRKKRNNRAICLGRLQEPATAAANRMGFMDRFWGRYPYAIGVA
ncbi:Glycolipid 2-alpha-mannosyltransferase 1, partial [Zalerion maritima]